MTGTKKESVYRKTRKGKGFSGVPKQGKLDEATCLNDQDSEINNEATSSASTSAAPSAQTSASRKKLSARGFEDTFTRCESSTSGYRLVDLSEFSTLVSEAHDCTSEGKYNLMTDFKIQSLLVEMCHNPFIFWSIEINAIKTRLEFVALIKQNCILLSYIIY